MTDASDAPRTPTTDAKTPGGVVPAGGNLSPVEVARAAAPVLAALIAKHATNRQASA